MEKTVFHHTYVMSTCVLVQIRCELTCFDHHWFSISCSF